MESILVGKRSRLEGTCRILLLISVAAYKVPKQATIWYWKHCLPAFVLVLFLLYWKKKSILQGLNFYTNMYMKSQKYISFECFIFSWNHPSDKHVEFYLYYTV